VKLHRYLYHLRITVTFKSQACPTHTGLSWI